MNKISPTKITRPEPYLLQAEWADGKTATISLEMLRRECPCAYCKGEQVGTKVYSKPMEIKNRMGTFEIVFMKPVGNYAVAIRWKNGHDSGIYTWDYFREIMVKNDINGNEKVLKEEAEKYEVRKKQIELLTLKIANNKNRRMNRNQH